MTAQGVSESNVLEYMGCIEQRAAEIIHEYSKATNSNRWRYSVIVTVTVKVTVTLMVTVTVMVTVIVIVTVTVFCYV